MTGLAPMRPLRSWLFTPATKPERFAKAKQAGADVLIIDLEDAVAASDKDRARAAALDYLSAAVPLSDGNGEPARALRINSIKTRAGLADALALLDALADPAFLVLPKTEAAADLRILDEVLTTAGKQVRLVALIESAAALAHLEAIATATPRLAALLFGAADMAADLGAETAWDPLLGARQRLVAAAALSGILPIDTPFFDLHDADGLAAETKRAIACGFTGKAAIHPTQVAPINTALMPGKAAIAHARRVLAENAKGVGTVDGQMIDEAVARKARRTLAAAGESA